MSQVTRPGETHRKHATRLRDSAQSLYQNLTLGAIFPAVRVPLVCEHARLAGHAPHDAARERGVRLFYDLADAAGNDGDRPFTPS